MYLAIDPVDKTIPTLFRFPLQLTFIYNILTKSQISPLSITPSTSVPRVRSKPVNFSPFDFYRHVGSIGITFVFLCPPQPYLFSFNLFPSGECPAVAERRPRRAKSPARRRRRSTRQLNCEWIDHLREE